MLLFWSLSALLFINLSLNSSFRIFFQKAFFYCEPFVFLYIGLGISIICLLLGFIFYRQNRASAFYLNCKNDNVEVSASFIKDLVGYFFKKQVIDYQKLDVVVHKQRIKVFVTANTISFDNLTKFERDLGDVLTYQVGYDKPFKVSFELCES